MVMVIAREPSCIALMTVLRHGCTSTSFRGMPGASRPADTVAMLHVRVVSPDQVTGRLVDWLESDPGVVNLVVLRAAAADHGGDAVQFDVLAGSANPVL